MTGAGDILVWDNHACMPLRPGDGRFLPQLERARSAGVNAITLNIGFGPQSVEEHLRVLAWFRAWLSARPEDYVLARTAADIEQARATGRLAVTFDIEGAGGIDDQPSLIELYYELGVRWMLVAYNKASRAGGGCYDEDEGLTAFGGEMIREMNRVGMVLCCSHTGQRTALEAIEVSSAPVIFSHSNASAVHDHPRNIPDVLIRACAASGGVIGVNGVSDFLGDGGGTEALLRHVDHITGLVGADHVGISLDHVYDRQELDAYLTRMRGTFPDMPADLSFLGPEALPAIRAGLEERGYGAEAVRKIMGENWLRVARAAWR